MSIGCLHIVIPPRPGNRAGFNVRCAEYYGAISAAVDRTCAEVCPDRSRYRDDVLDEGRKYLMAPNVMAAKAVSASLRVAQKGCVIWRADTCPLLNVNSTIRS